MQNFSISFYNTLIANVLTVRTERRINMFDFKRRLVMKKKTKVIIYVLGIVYLAMAALQIFAVQGQGIISELLIKNSFLSVVDIAALVCLAMRKRTLDIVALCLVLIFMVTMYVTTMVL